MARNRTILDCYTDEPAGLGVPPYLGVWPRYVAGQYKEDLPYLTIDDLVPRFTTSLEKATYPHSDTGPKMSLTKGQWYHIAATYSMFESRLRFYVDGKPEMDTRYPFGAMRLTAEPLRIGTGLKGAIDELILYPRALSPEEVAELAK